MPSRPSRPVLSLLALVACASDPKPAGRPPPSETSEDTPASPLDSAPHGTGTARPPNLLVVLADDLGTDKVASYGEHPIPAPLPNVDALAAQGVLFRNAWAYPECSPTRAALLTGRYGRRTGVGTVVDAYVGFYELPPREITISEMLATARDPWSSSAVGKWHLATFYSDDAERHPGVQGFPWYRTNVSNIEQSTDHQRIETYYDWELDADGEMSWQTTYLTTFQVDTAIARIAETPEPWFLYLALTAPHTPLNVPPRDLYTLPTPGPSQAERYYAVAEAMDTELGRLFASVDLSDTVVVFMGDNGTPDHAILPPADPSASKLTMYEGGINVPLIVAGPVVDHPGESAALVHAVDVFATAADLAGVDPSTLVDERGEPVPIDGQSLLPYLADPDAPGRPYVYTESFHPLGLGPRTKDTRAVRDGRFKLISDELTGREQLFDLADRVDDGPDLLASGTPLDATAQAALVRLEAALQGFRDELVPPRE